MRVIFKKSYEADIRLFKDGVQAFWYLLLLVIAVILPFLINEYWVGEFSLMLIWAIAGIVSMYFSSSLKDLSIYFASLTGFVASWIAGEKIKPEDEVNQNIKK